jgi:hypothetical protein
MSSIRAHLAGCMKKNGTHRAPRKPPAFAARNVKTQHRAFNLPRGVAGRQGGGETCVKTKDIRKFAAEQGVSEEEALKKGMEEKSREFVEVLQPSLKLVPLP